MIYADAATRHDAGLRRLMLMAPYALPRQARNNVHVYRITGCHDMLRRFRHAASAALLILRLRHFAVSLMFLLSYAAAFLLILTFSMPYDIRRYIRCAAAAAAIAAILLPGRPTYADTLRRSATLLLRHTMLICHYITRCHDLLR